MAEVDFTLHQRRMEKLEAAGAPARGQGAVGGGGSGPHDPDMEARVAKLEAGIEAMKSSLARIEVLVAGMDGKFDAVATSAQVGLLFSEAKDVTRKGLDDARDRHDRDFRITFAAVIAVALGLAGLMAKGFHWL